MLAVGALIESAHRELGAFTVEAIDITSPNHLLGEGGPPPLSQACTCTHSLGIVELLLLLEIPQVEHVAGEGGGCGVDDSMEWEGRGYGAMIKDKEVVEDDVDARRASIISVRGEAIRRTG